MTTILTTEMLKDMNMLEQRDVLESWTKDHAVVSVHFLDGFLGVVMNGYYNDEHKRWEVCVKEIQPNVGTNTRVFRLVDLNASRHCEDKIHENELNKIVTDYMEKYKGIVGEVKNYTLKTVSEEYPRMFHFVVTHAYRK